MLERIREEIADIDRKMAALFEERMRLSKQVAECKRAEGLPVFDPGQEKHKLDTSDDNISDLQFSGYYKRFLQNLMDLSKEYQNDLSEPSK